MSDGVTNNNYEADIVVAPSAPAGRFLLVRSKEFGERPPVSWLVKGILPATGIGSIYGPSGSGKSFLAVHLGCALASEKSFFGHRIRKNVPVVFIALEAEGGIPGRIRAWCLKNDRPTPEGLRLLEITDGKPFRLDDADDMRALGLQVLEDVGPGAAVFIDTLAMAAGSLDENSATDMSSAILGAKALQAACAGLVLLVHHTGKDSSKGMRGSSALNAAMDVVIEVTRNGDVRGWRLAKSKEGRDGITAAFTLCDVPLGKRDEDGDELTSVAVVWDQNAGVVPIPVRAPAGKNQVAVLAAIRERLTSSDSAVISFSMAVAIGTTALKAAGMDARRARAEAGSILPALVTGRFLVQGGSVLSTAGATISLPA
jgi:putative DNA primase/helicase